MAAVSTVGSGMSVGVGSGVGDGVLVGMAVGGMSVGVGGAAPAHPANIAAATVADASSAVIGVSLGMVKICWKTRCDEVSMLIVAHVIRH